jgi:hypothetical protein
MTESKKYTLEGLVYPFESSEFKEMFELWLKYRTKKKKPIKIKLSQQGQLKKLARLSGLNEQIAIDIINQSIEEGWVGLWAITNNGNNEGTSTTNNDLAAALAKHYGA